MIKLNDLIGAYFVARKNKRRSVDSVEYELHCERNLLTLCSEVNDRILSPTAYAFVTLKPRPREIFACEMGMRVIHHYIDIRMRPLIESRLTDRTYNNRIGYGQDVAINQLITNIYQVSKGFTRDAWIIKMDIKGYFPNANLDVAYKQLSSLILESYDGKDRDDLLYLLERSVYSYPHLHCYRKSAREKWCYISDDKSKFKQPDGIGGAIGHLLWQNAMNYYLNDFDHYVIDDLRLQYVRFVDDMVFVVENKEAFLPMVAKFREILKTQYHCELHPRKFYCQHWSKGVCFIGTFIKADKLYADRRILRNFKKHIDEFNRCARRNRVESFLASMNSYIGILKNRNGRAVVERMLKDVNPRWWKYVHYNPVKVCLSANEGYRHIELLSHKYNLKFKKYGTNKRNAGEYPSGRHLAERG